MIDAMSLMTAPVANGYTTVSAKIGSEYLYIAVFKTEAEAQSFITRAMLISTGAYWFKFLIGIDMLGAVIIFRDPDMTISSRTGLALRLNKPPRWAVVLGRFLNRLQQDHCELAIVHDIMRGRSAIRELGAL